MRFSVLILCWMTLGQHIVFTSLCTQVISQLLAKTVLIKIVRLLVKKNTVFAKYFLQGFSNKFATCHFIHPHSRNIGNEKTEQNMASDTLYNQCNQFLILVALGRQRGHSLSSLLASLHLLGKSGVGACGFLVIWFLRDRIGIQWGNLKGFR